MRERAKVSGYGRPRQMDVEGGPGVTMSQSSLFLQFWCHFYDLSVRRANFEKGEPLYLILTRNITSYHFKQKITKNQSFCGSCSFEFDVFHSIARKLSHLLNEIFPKLNSMIELIESLYLSLFQPLLSILNYLFSSLKSLVLSFFVLNADKIEPEFSASLNILSDAFLFDGKSSKSLFH